MYTNLYEPGTEENFKDFIIPYLEHSKVPIEELKYIPLFFKKRAFVQYFYFAYRVHNNITQGLEEGETNIQGFEDSLLFIETSLNLDKNYFYDLAYQALEE